MARKREVPPTHLYCVTTLCSKTNTTTNIAILDNSFKTSTPSIYTVINEMLWEFLNGVDVLKLLSWMAADTSSIATWFEQPHIILILSRDKFSH